MTKRQLAGRAYEQFFSDRIEQLQVWKANGRDERDKRVREACEEWLKL
jgi:hypothetical protein